jgi:cytochrome b561
MLPILAAPIAAKAIGFLSAPKTLVVLFVAGVTLSGWAMYWARGKRIDYLRATVAAAQAETAQYQAAYEHLAAVAVECNRATIALEARARETQAAAAQALSRARAAAATYQQQADALRAASAPPERSCAAAAGEIRKGLRP